MKGVVGFLKSALDLVYPRNCPFCAMPLEETERGVVCGACLGKAKPVMPPCCERCALPFPGNIEGHFTCGYCKDLNFHFSRCVAAYQAEGVVRDCIHQFKYNRQLHFGPHLADWIRQGARRLEWSEVDGIVPVALHSRKQREREFNQAECLARAVSKETGVPVMVGNLRRVKETVTQTHLDAKARAANLRGAFAVKKPEGFQGKRLVLVDDVFTTGATLDGCAKVLSQAGALDVKVLVLARGI